jgi:hypothetical protein
MLAAVVAAISLLVTPLGRTPEAHRLDSSLIGYEDVVYWLASPRDWRFYWIDPLWRWDALAYTGIAEHGYSAGALASTVFPPLYPLLVRGVQAFLPGEWVASGLLVSAAASLMCVLLLKRLVRLEFGRRAELAPLLLLVFPTAYYLAAPYAEGLFLALAIGTLLSARRGSWWWAAGMGAAASLTKLHGPALVVPLAILAWEHLRQTRRVPAGTLAALAAPLLGPVLLEVYSRLWLADTGPIAQQTGRWGWQIVAPGWPLVEAVRQLLAHGVRFVADAVDLPIVLGGLAWLVWGWRRLPAYLWWYGLAVLLPGLSRLMYPPLAANTRFLVLAFPIVIAMALWCDRPWRRVALVSTSLVLQLCLLVLFVHWTWIA